MYTRPVEPGFPGTEIRDNDSLGAQPAECGPLWDPPATGPWGPSPCQHQGSRVWSASRAKVEVLCVCKGRRQLEPVRQGSRPEWGAQMTPHVWVSLSLSIKDILGQKKGDVQLQKVGGSHKEALLISRRRCLL